MDRQRRLLDHPKGRRVLNPGVPASGRGLSIIEVVIALAIMAVLVVLAAPGFSAMIAGLQVRTAAEKTLGALQLARAEAAKRNASVLFNIDSLQGAGWSVKLAADDSVLTSYSEQEGSRDVMMSMSGDLGPITFNSLGQRVTPTADVGTVTLGFTRPSFGDCEPAGPVRCINVTITIGGQARMCDPALTDATNPQKC
jgi:type IV fimbrial biogenesis protein FimT